MCGGKGSSSFWGSKCVPVGLATWCKTILGHGNIWVLWLCHCKPLALYVPLTNGHSSIWNLLELFPSFLGSSSPPWLFITAVSELCILTVSFLSPYSGGSVWGRDTQEKHETCKVPCHEEFGWLISCSWVFGSLLEVCGLSVICSTPERGMEPGGRWFSPAKGNPHLGAPGRAC